MFKVPEKYRKSTNSNSHYDSSRGDMYGVFLIPTNIKNVFLLCIASEGDETIQWEHVSISVKKVINNKYDNKPIILEVPRCPTWEEMCKIKDLFWDGTDTVVQFHPPESEYVSQHHYCLHLWRKCGENFETPPSITVGTQIGKSF